MYVGQTSKEAESLLPNDMVLNKPPRSVSEGTACEFDECHVSMTQYPPSFTGDALSRTSSEVSFVTVDSDSCVIDIEEDPNTLQWKQFEEDLSLRMACSTGVFGLDGDTVLQTMRRLPNYANKHRLDKQAEYSKKVLETFKRVATWTFSAVPLKYRLLYVLQRLSFRHFVLMMLFFWIPMALTVAWYPKACVIMVTFVVCIVVLANVLKRCRSGLVVVNDPVLEAFCTGLVRPDAPHAGSFEPGDLTRCKPQTFPVAFTTAHSSIWIPRMCCHNDNTAILKRQLIPCDVPEQQLHEAATLSRDAFLEAFVGLPAKTYDRIAASDDEMIERYRAHLKTMSTQRLLEFDKYHKNLAMQLRVPDGRITRAFVKQEVLVGKEPSKRHPRLISGKTGEYLHATGPEYYDFQTWLCKTYFPDDVDKLLSRRFIYPGKVSPTTLGLIISHYESCGWHAYEGDFSRLDGHTESPFIEMECDIYNALGMSPRLIKLLTHQAGVTKGTTSRGAKFKVKGKRASGVINTTIGNTIVCMAMTAAAFKIQQIEDYVVIQLGDDNVILTKEKMDAARYCNFMKDCGHSLDLVYRGVGQDAFDSLEFCSQLFWDIGDQRILGPKPFRALAKTFAPAKQINPSQLMTYASGVATGYKHYMWVPALNTVCDMLIQRHKPSKKAKLADEAYKLRLKKTIVVDSIAVSSHFYRRYGIDPTEIDNLLRQVDVSRPVAISHPLITRCNIIDGVTSEAEVVTSSEPGSLEW